MIKTSPIEMTTESFGNRMFIVATQTEISENSNHWREKLLWVEKMRKTNGMATRYTPNR
jgi:hypothetical protein